MAAQFCGRCGAPLMQGAAFCGVCRTPVVAPVGAAASSPAYAVPQYAYPYAPPPAARIGGGGRSTQIAVAGGLIVILIIVAVAVSLLAYRAVNGSHSNCTANCSPKLVTPLAAAATYRSSAFKYEVDYSDTWTVRSQDANGILLGTKIGFVSVEGSKAGPSLDQVVQATVAALPSATWQSVALVSTLKGAHLGDQDGLGEIFSANLIGANSKAAVVRFAVIAASKGNVTVVVFAADPADPAHSPNGMPEGYLFDYMCTQLRWGG